jgi:hypothetical protein
MPHCTDHMAVVARSTTSSAFLWLDFHSIGHLNIM